jgi:hypothetical protein
MADNFQNKAVVRTPKAAKTVMVKTKSDATEVVAAATTDAYVHTRMEKVRTKHQQ